MKTTLKIAVVALAGLMTASAASAQVYESRSYAKKTTITREQKPVANNCCKSYGRFQLGYNNTTIFMKHDSYWSNLRGDEKKSRGLNGFELGYLQGISLSKTLPMFLEVGGNLAFDFYGESRDFDYYKLSDHFFLMNLNIPVHFAWKFCINKDLAVIPYAGLNLKFNIVANQTLSAKSDEYDLDETDTTNWLSSDDIENDDFRMNVFQIGWEAGATLKYNKFFFGLQYGTDFSQLSYYMNTGTFKAYIGFGF